MEEWTIHTFQNFVEPSSLEERHVWLVEVDYPDPTTPFELQFCYVECRKCSTAGVTELECPECFGWADARFRPDPTDTRILRCFELAYITIPICL
jgi:hypothetical protein